MSLALDTSKPFRSPQRQRDLVQALADAPTSTQESNWIEWKGDADMSQQRWQVELARQVLGFANRDPVTAAKSAGGCGYIVFGATPGHLLGTRHVDASKLEDGVSKYVGRPPKSPEWAPHYVEFDGGHEVLVITVEPPSYGDPIWTCLKGFQPDERVASPVNEGSAKSVRRGAIYTRRKASTETAQPEDVEMLTRRACTTDTRISGVSLSTLSNSTGVAIDLREVVTDRWAEGERAALQVRPRSAPKVRTSHSEDAIVLDTVLKLSTISSHAASFATEPRTAAQYQEEVDAYVEKGVKKMPLVLTYHAIERGLGRIEVLLTNESKRNLREVEVELVFEEKGVAAFFEGEIGYQSMPDRPLEFGKGSRFGSLSRTIRMPYIPQFPALPTIRRGHIENDRSARITFGSVDLYPKKAELLEPFFLITHPVHAGTMLTAGWAAVAKDVDDTQEGVLQVEIGSAVLSTDDLMAEPPYDEE